METKPVHCNGIIQTDRNLIRIKEIQDEKQTNTTDLIHFRFQMNWINNPVATIIITGYCFQEKIMVLVNQLSYTFRKSSHLLWLLISRIRILKR